MQNVIDAYNRIKFYRKGLETWNSKQPTFEVVMPDEVVSEFCDREDKAIVKVFGDLAVAFDSENADDKLFLTNCEKMLIEFREFLKLYTIVRTKIEVTKSSESDLSELNNRFCEVKKLVNKMEANWKGIYLQRLERLKLAEKENIDDSNKNDEEEDESRYRDEYYTTDRFGCFD